MLENESQNLEIWLWSISKTGFSYVNEVDPASV